MAEDMHACGIKVFFSCFYELEKDELWQKIELPNKADVDYSCIGVKASNYIMLPEVFGDKGSGGGGWMPMNHNMQVTPKEGKVRFDYSCIGVKVPADFQ